MLDLVTHQVWLGKDVDLGGGVLPTTGNAGEALLAHWCNRARALAPWVLLVLVFDGHFLADV